MTATVSFSRRRGFGALRRRLNDTVAVMRRLLCVLLVTAIQGATLLPAAKKVILPPEFVPARGAPAPPYSPGLLVDGTLYISGQIGQNLRTKDVPADFETEVKMCLENVGLV